MVTITYDLDNAEDCKLIEDYYFFKYYNKCLFNDWNKQYKQYALNSDDSYNKKGCDFITDIITKSVNKEEFTNFIRIYNMLEKEAMIKESITFSILNSCLIYDYDFYHIRLFQDILVEKFGKNKKYIN